MKKIFLVFAVGILFGCSDAEKKAEAPAAGKKATPAAAAAKKPPSGKGFADEDISKPKPAQTNAGEESTVSCQGMGDDLRTIAIAKEGGGCKVDYTKAGSTQTIASAAADFNYCQEKSDKVRVNLESAGFKCQ